MVCKVLLLLSSYVEDLAAHIDSLSGKESSDHMGDSYSPLESLYSVVPILAKICNDGSNGRTPRSLSPRTRSKNRGGRNERSDFEDADVIDRLLLERTVDLINQVVQVHRVCRAQSRPLLSQATNGTDISSDNDATGSASSAHV